MTQIKINNTDTLPKCPYCNKDLDTVEKNTKGIWERHVVYMCPHCKKLLSIGNDVGFGS